jgi:ssDNA-binding Zn-finger/Zn-ribbon topoisomerase 1
MFKVEKPKYNKIICDKSCPECGKALVARYSPRNCQMFWGCSDYPKCKGTLSVKYSDKCPKCGENLKQDLFSGDTLTVVTAVCTRKGCGFTQEVERQRFSSYSSHSKGSWNNGWDDAQWHEYADYCGVDESVCWGGDG